MGFKVPARYQGTKKLEAGLYGLLWPRGETFFWKAILLSSAKFKSVDTANFLLIQKFLTR
ncbi:MAG: hypothetical protein DLM68_06510 [Hyphomicrobiales bacterium]|nr:MAG: hypothetical protein DLM68_06510 [Hyphomicrobiales bacterium]